MAEPLKSRLRGRDSAKDPVPQLSRREQLLAAARPGQTPRYNDFKALIESFGFRLASVNRLHNIFVHERVLEPINLQNINGEIRPFQVRQFVNLIYRYRLQATDEAETIPVFDPKAMP